MNQSFEKQKEVRDREAFRLWMVRRFNPKVMIKAEISFYEHFDRSYREGLVGLAGDEVLAYVGIALLNEPYFYELKEFGYSPNQISLWRLWRKEEITSLRVFPADRIPELVTFITDGTPLHLAITSALWV